MEILCPYCGSVAEMVDGTIIYPRHPSLSRKLFYLCKPCDAYVGTYKGSHNPMGPLANAELRKARSDAHAAFDPIWENNFAPRKKAYLWLAIQLNIDVKECHIGFFDIKQCQQVINICEEKIIVMKNHRKRLEEEMMNLIWTI